MRFAAESAPVFFDGLTEVNGKQSKVEILHALWDFKAADFYKMLLLFFKIVMHLFKKK